MVLSNKKLKQKLRAELAESLAAIVAGTPSNGSKKQDAKSHSQSLRELLSSVAHKPRLSKREKKRETLSLQGSKPVEGSNGDNTQIENNGIASEVQNDKKKKRKRKRDGGGDQERENGVSESAEKKPVKKPKKKKKKKNKKKRTESGDGEGKEETVAEPVKVNDSQENGEMTRKVYVGGIPYYSSEDDIKSFFESCGTITEVDCMRFPESGKFRGIAIITFKTEAAAKRALALDGADMGELFLKIQPYKTTRVQKSSDFAPEIVEGYNRIYIGNLSWDMTEDELRKLFSDCNISSIRLGKDKETGEFRGYAHVDFSDSLSLTIALSLDQKMVCGRPVRIRCAVPKKEPDNHPKLESGSKKAEKSSVSSGNGKKKNKRRTCYECGVPGHLSSACPRKKAVDQENCPK
ncbi:PREDICTED: protein gar2 [Nelumbo nucifera]|uniref:Protein gar2 n=2 Tax=Nelumbo nucifera TaxID=4432 RepID=A0A1U7ZJJ0_NELNU|nr:PREDICTED: protein gar2 [Nelumbo nucifera]XP_010253298.1 PREDICTED: protein gar2 [Nelumbo nucifera]DAD25921.1 TPA_asm: hypothetical protein HUJ06_027389 [Nelumbo nucifera]